MAQAPHEPTPQTRALVQEAAGMGIPQPMICHLMRVAGHPVSEPTLLKYYSDELSGGKAVATLQVAKTLFHQATVGKNLGAAIFWLKAQAGWREKQEVDANVRSDMRAVHIVTGVPRAMDEMTDQELMRIAAGGRRRIGGSRHSDEDGGNGG